MKNYISFKSFLLLSLSFILVSCSGTGRVSKKDLADVKMAQSNGEKCDADYSEVPDEEDAKQMSGPAQQLVSQTQDLYSASGDYINKKEYDRALTALDEAYSKLLKIDIEERGGEYQQIEDLRFMISKRIMEIYAMRKDGTKAVRNEIPIVLNAHVNREIKSLTTNERNFFVAALSRSSRYMPMIKAKMKTAGIPVELAWLPLIESGYKVNAYSPARALGMWQFIASTGHRYGLKRDEYIDERMDPEKSTDAAIAYLKELHQMFGDWETVLAAYNCGEGRVLRTIRTQDINYLDNFWDLYGKLPSETARYVPRFIATLHIVNNLKDYDLDSLGYEPPLSYETVNVSRRASLKDLGRASGLSECVLRDLNPELRHGILPPASYGLRVPSDYSEKIIASISTLQESVPPRDDKAVASGSSAEAYHKVSRGETMASIARKYNKSVYELIRANNFKKKTRLTAGTMVRIPKSSVSSSKAVASVSKSGNTQAQSGKISNYKVKKGDTLWTIAKNYGTTPDRITSLNKLNGSSVQVGRTIKVPSGKDSKVSDVSGSSVVASVSQKASRAEMTSKSSRSRVAVKSAPLAYKVKQGDNLFSIARQHNMSVDRIIGLNRLPKDVKIFPGQTLAVE